MALALSFPIFLPVFVRNFTVLSQGIKSSAAFTAFVLCSSACSCMYLATPHGLMASSLSESKRQFPSLVSGSFVGLSVLCCNMAEHIFRICSSGNPHALRIGFAMAAPRTACFSFFSRINPFFRAISCSMAAGMRTDKSAPSFLPTIFAFLTILSTCPRLWSQEASLYNPGSLDSSLSTGVML
jgi:hypothetical protein